MFELHQWLYHLHNKNIHPESIWKSSFFAQYVACWRFFSWKGPRLVPWCVRGLILRAFFFSPCRAQSVHIGNEQQCGCDISENANTIISTPPLSLSQHQYLCAHGGGSEIPGPEFALSWQGKRLIRTHAPLLVTLPASPAQHATLDLNAFFSLFSSSCWMCCDVWAAVEMRDWFNKERVFSVEGGCSSSSVFPPRLSPEMAPVKWFDACCKGGHFLLSTELHMAPHQEELNQRCRSPHVRTAARGSLAGFT